MKITDEQAQAAASVNLIDYCAAHGIPLVRHSGETYRHAEYDSLKITENRWKRFSEQTGDLGKYTQGNTVHFVMEYEGKPFREAVQVLLEFAGSPLAEDRQSLTARIDQLKKAKTVARTHTHAGPAKEQEPVVANSKQPQQNVSPAQQGKTEPQHEKQAATKQKTAKPNGLEMPKKNNENKHVFAYLTTTRGIDKDIVREMLNKKILFEDTYRNCVFVGYDKNNIAAFASKKGTNSSRPYAGDVRGSKKIYGWKYEANKATTLRVFESPIDALSFMTLEKNKNKDWHSANYLALSGVAHEAVHFFLKNNNHITDVELCLDNDESGIKASNSIKSELDKDINCKIIQPTEKDFNNDLLAKKKVELGNTLER